jgi:hypothetical protein
VQLNAKLLGTLSIENDGSHVGTLCNLAHLTFLKKQITSILAVLQIQTLRLLIVFLTTLYAFLVSNAVGPLKCDYDSMSLTDEPSIKCFDEFWFAYLPTVIFFIMLYGIALPFMLAWILINNRSAAEDNQVNEVLGLLTMKYVDECYWWEFVSVFKKLLFSVSSAFLRSLKWQHSSLFVSVSLLCVDQVLKA